jgi:hypothetical protein
MSPEEVISANFGDRVAEIRGDGVSQIGMGEILVGQCPPNLRVMTHKAEAIAEHSHANSISPDCLRSAASLSNKLSPHITQSLPL